jgi:hypothetical protein
MALSATDGKRLYGEVAAAAVVVKTAAAEPE